MSSEMAGQQSVATLFPKKPKTKSIDDIQTKYVHSVTNFIIAESQSFTIVASPEFCSLFCPFHYLSIIAPSERRNLNAWTACKGSKQVGSGYPKEIMDNQSLDGLQ